jgi:hypothetical protein
MARINWDRARQRELERTAPPSDNIYRFGWASNKYAGPCRVCGVPVAADAGIALRIRGRWVLHCHQCATPAATEAVKP